MFGKKQKTLFDYIAEHDPYFEIEEMILPKYPEGTASAEHKELENLLEEYWDLLHPAVCDFINSYATVVKGVSIEIGESRDNIENARRQLTFEQQNVQDLADEIRELKGELQNALVIKRDLESRLEDERAMLQSQFKEEKRALELIANSKFEGDLDGLISSIREGVGDSEKVRRLEVKVADLESQIKKEREENENIQGELSTSFMEKITKYDEMIKNLKSRLNE